MKAWVDAFVEIPWFFELAISLQESIDRQGTIHLSSRGRDNLSTPQPTYPPKRAPHHDRCHPPFVDSAGEIGAKKTFQTAFQRLVVCGLGGTWVAPLEASEATGTLTAFANRQVQGFADLADCERLVHPLPATGYRRGLLSILSDRLLETAPDSIRFQHLQGD